MSFTFGVLRIYLVSFTPIEIFIVFVAILKPFLLTVELAKWISLVQV